MKELVVDQMHSDVETMTHQLHKCLRARTTVSLFSQFYSLIENKLPSNVYNKYPLTHAWHESIVNTRSNIIIDKHEGKAKVLINYC